MKLRPLLFFESLERRAKILEQFPKAGRLRQDMAPDARFFVERPCIILYRIYTRRRSNCPCPSWRATYRQRLVRGGYGICFIKQRALTIERPPTRPLSQISESDEVVSRQARRLRCRIRWQTHQERSIIKAFAPAAIATVANVLNLRPVPRQNADAVDALVQPDSTRSDGRGSLNPRVTKRAVFGHDCSEGRQC